jgi:hypothetical protein
LKRVEICREVSHWICRNTLQDVANGQLKKRWSLVSNSWVSHSMHSFPPSICQFFLLIRSFLLSLSMKNNQPKTLSFIRNLDFQSSCGVWSTRIAPKLNLYNFAYEVFPQWKL